MMTEKTQDKFNFSIEGKDYSINEKLGTTQKKYKKKLIHGPSIGIGAAIAVIILLGVFFSLNGLTNDYDQDMETKTISNPIQISNEIFLKHRSPILGSHNAPITLVEFGDFQCHFCNVHFQNTEHKLLENYVVTGKVNIIFKDFTIVGPDSINAAHAAHCAGEQNKYWEYHDILYNNWSGENTGWAAKQNLTKFANEIELDLQSFEQCMNSKRYNDMINQSNLDASKLGITGTPAFIIIDNNNERAEVFQGAQPYKTFEKVFNSILEN